MKTGLLFLLCTLGISTMSATTFAETKDFQNWQKPSAQTLKEQLSSEQFKVTQKDGTEKAFTGKYWDTKSEGIYVDIVSGEALFSSNDKYDSGTGWPSFSAPISEQALTTKTDKKLWATRTEVRSRWADSHLGHVFDDGPLPSGKRYCINSAALRFIPLAQLESTGYTKYLPLFQK